MSPRGRVSFSSSFFNTGVRKGFSFHGCRRLHRSSIRRRLFSDRSLHSYPFWGRLLRQRPVGRLPLCHGLRCMCLSYSRKAASLSALLAPQASFPVCAIKGSIALCFFSALVIASRPTPARHWVITEWLRSDFKRRQDGVLLVGFLSTRTGHALPLLAPRFGGSFF